MLEATLNSGVMYANVNSKAGKASGPRLYQKGRQDAQERTPKLPTGSPHGPRGKLSPSTHNALLTLTPAEGAGKQKGHWGMALQSLGLEATDRLWMANELPGTVWLHRLSCASVSLV